MRGSPLLRAIIAFFIISLAGIPLWKLTHRASAVMEVSTTREAIKTSPAHIEVTLTQPANRITIRHLGKVVWTSESVQTSAEADIPLVWPREGVDLRVQIDWPADAPLAAARLRITDPEGTEHEQSIWSKGPSDDVLTFR